MGKSIFFLFCILQLFALSSAQIAAPSFNVNVADHEHESSDHVYDNQNVNDDHHDDVDLLAHEHSHRHSPDEPIHSHGHRHTQVQLFDLFSLTGYPVDVGVAAEEESDFGIYKDKFTAGPDLGSLFRPPII